MATCLGGDPFTKAPEGGIGFPEEEGRAREPWEQGQKLGPFAGPVRRIFLVTQRLA